MKGGSFGVWKNAPGSWLLGWSTASNSSDESSLFESSGEGMIGDAGCRCVRSMSDACGRGGSDTLRARRCRDSILYRLVLAYFTAHDDWASQHNITIMCRAIPHIMRSFPAITRQTQDTFPHSCNAFLHSRLARVLAHLRVSSRIIMFYCASSRFIAHHHVLSRIFACHRASSHSIAFLRVYFAFHRDLVRIIAGASIHCPASSLVRHIPFITISDYVWHRTIIISLWTLTLPHLHT